jgi:hypothetical protein
MNRLTRREMLTLVSGFVVGLLIGMVLIGSSEDLRTSIFGTAAQEKTVKMEYYLANLESAQDWLIQTYPDNTEKLQASVSVLTKAPAAGFTFDFKAAEEDIQFILPQAYGALLGEKDPANLKVEKSDTTSVCLGVDDDPYEGTTMYLYFSIPTDRAKQFDIPKDWEKLKDPKMNVMYWKLVGCYPEPEK